MMAFSILARVTRLFGLHRVPQPWRKLDSTGRDYDIILFGLDGDVAPGHVKRVVNQLSTELGCPVIPQSLWERGNYTFYKDTLTPTPHIRFHSWEVGGARQTIELEREIVLKMRGVLVFIIDATDDDRIVECLEEYQTFLHRCPPENASMVITFNGVLKDTRWNYSRAAVKDRLIVYADVDLDDAASMRTAWTRLVDALIERHGVYDEHKP